MATLIWTEPAVADLEEIGQFISKDNPPAAEKVGSKIIREAENVAAFPRLGRIVPEFGNPQIREIISQSYRVIYKFDEEGDLVAILRIWHGADFDSCEIVDCRTTYGCVRRLSAISKIVLATRTRFLPSKSST